MILKTSDLFLLQKDIPLFAVCIKIPDGSNPPNYLELDPPRVMDDALTILDEIVGTDLDEVMRPAPDQIIQEGTYFRLNLVIRGGTGEPYIFHSRKLNLLDAVKERSLLIAEYSLP